MANGHGSSPRQRVSITDVARDAGVSVTTVSHVLSGRRPVAATTKAKVHAVIDRLGYVPNELARSMRSRRTNTVGIVIPDITNPFFPVLVRGALDVLTPAGYVGIVCDTANDPAVERAVIDQLVRRQVDALAIASGHSDNDGLGPAVEAGMPVVHLGGAETEPGVDVVVTDDFSGGEQIAAHLISRGYRRIAFVRRGLQGPPEQRLAGFTAEHERSGVPLDPSLVLTLGPGQDHRILSLLLDREDPPDAVACVNDMLALAVLAQAHERGLTVPDDLAVTGFDDIPAAALVSPTLTTVGHQVREMGMLVARTMLERVEADGVGEPRKVVIPAQLVHRASS